MKNKSEVHHHTKLRIKSLKNKENTVNCIRCDDAGEYEPLKKYCDENRIKLEMIAPNISQHNGVVESSSEIDLIYLRAMLYHANLAAEMASSLWEMAFFNLQYTQDISSTMATQAKISSNSKYGNEEDLNIAKMQPF